jgi:hypothetical protein
MKETVWPTGSKDTTFFAGMLLMSSVHLDSMRLGGLTSTTTTLKLEAIALVRERIREANPNAIISALSAIACLATSALVCVPTDPAPPLYNK